MPSIADQQVAETFDDFEPSQRMCLLAMRDLVFETAHGNPSVGPLTETLKWGEPSYRPEKTKSGVAVRLGRFGDSHVALFVNCQTTLVDSWRERFPRLEFSGTRALVIDPNAPLPVAELEECIDHAFTYKLRKRN